VRGPPTRTLHTDYRPGGVRRIMLSLLQNGAFTLLLGVAAAELDDLLSLSAQQNLQPDEATLASMLAAPGSKSYAVGGRGFNDTLDYWTRLPAAAKCSSGTGCVRDIVWKLSLDSSGMFIQFR
jgi:hypothetical protein